ncbi:MAG TPA: hypothetical protein VGE40_07185 [Bacilli bacterium]
MITDEMLDEYRLKGTKVRVIRDINETNDVLGIVLAWDEETVLIRKQNRKVLKLNRKYMYQAADEVRPNFIDL